MIVGTAVHDEIVHPRRSDPSGLVYRLEIWLTQIRYVGKFHKQNERSVIRGCAEVLNYWALALVGYRSKVA